MIELPTSLYEEMVAYCRAGLPNEACGVVAGKEARAVRLYPMRNAEESPVVYRFDEREQLAVFTEVEREGLDLLGFFHSHTHTEAFPSPTDRARAHWTDPVTGGETAAYPETSYLILSLKDAEPTLRSFRFVDGEAVEEDVSIG